MSLRLYLLLSLGYFDAHPSRRIFVITGKETETERLIDREREPVHGGYMQVVNLKTVYFTVSCHRVWTSFFESSI